MALQETRGGLARWPVALVVVLVAVVAAFDPRGRWAFPPPKEAVLTAGTALVLVLACLDRTLSRRAPPGGIDRGLAVTAGLFALWWSLAPAFAAGNPELHLLEVTRLLAPLLLGVLVALAVAGQGQRVSHLVSTTCGVLGGVTALIALLQAAGGDPLALVAGRVVDATGRWRVIATLGHPSWTAELVAVCTPFSMDLATRLVRGRRSRAAFLVPVAAWTIALAAVVATASRVGLAALVGGTVAWLVVRSRASGAPVGSPILPVAATLAAALAGAVLWGPLAARLGSAEPVKGRVALAVAASELAASSPLVGHGAGHFQVLLPVGLQRAADRLPDGWLPRTLVDRVDNDVLQVAVEGGLPAAALLLVTWLLAARRAGAIRTDGHRRPRPAVLGALVALGVAALGSVPLRTPATAAVFWMVVALAAVDARDPDRVPTARPAGRSGRRWRWLVVAAATLLATTAVDHSLDVLAGNRLAMAARGADRDGDAARAVDLYRQALERTPWDHDSRASLGQLLVAQGEYATGLEVVREAQRWGASQRAWLAESRALAATGRLQQAITVLEDAVAAVPEGRALQIQLGDLLLAAGRPGDAARAFRLALVSRQSTPSSSAQRELAARRLESLAGRD